MTKDLIRAELEKLSKDDLINIIAEVINAYVVASMNRKMMNASCIQQCVRNIHTDTQQVVNDICQQLDVNFRDIVKFERNPHKMNSTVFK